MPTDNEFFLRWIDGIVSESGITVRTENPTSPLAKATSENVRKSDDSNKFKIQSILANHEKNAFTVVWADHTSTVIHLQEGDTWDNEKALAMCFVKKLMGNKGSFNNIFTEIMPEKLKTIPAKEKQSESAGVKKLRETCATIGIDIAPSASQVTSKFDELDKKINEVQKTNAEIESTAKSVAKEVKESIDSFNSLIDQICGKDKKTYNLYLYSLYTKTTDLLCGTNDLATLHKLISKEQQRRSSTPYIRYWEGDNGLYFDYGSYSYYFFVPGLTANEYRGSY